MVSYLDNQKGTLKNIKLTKPQRVAAKSADAWGSTLCIKKAGNILLLPAKPNKPIILTITQSYAKRERVQLRVIGNVIA